MSALSKLFGEGRLNRFDMSFKPVQVFGFIMSFAYVFFGLLFITTTFGDSLISDPPYRKLFGGTIVAYGLFRVAYFIRKMREKS